MNNIPIFDSLSHPTLNGNWIMPNSPNISRIEILLDQMSNANVKWSFIVGMQGIGNYSETEFIKLIQYSNDIKLYPIAFYEFSQRDISSIRDDLIRIKNIGYSGIKIHPRILNTTINKTICNLISIANELGLVPLLCTYNYSCNNAQEITPECIMKMLRSTGNPQVILMHSGTVRVLEYMEIARNFSNVLLDLSFTILKYAGSSLDLDIRFLFHHFDERICIGSDFPEYSVQQLRSRFEYFTEGLSISKTENVANRNLLNFLKKSRNVT